MLQKPIKKTDKELFSLIEEKIERGQYVFLSQDWKYCIEGHDIDKNTLRIIITFSDDLMPIITVMRIQER